MNEQDAIKQLKQGNIKTSFSTLSESKVSEISEFELSTEVIDRFQYSQRVEG
ncbi:MAG: hypothetical protein GFH23_1086710n12 [Chloroflexi bacterium AL-N1]|nr:hypothetical protein [Chloroflexi bacterium AL-N1]